MADYAQFDQDKIDAALDAARRHNETFKLQAPGSAADLSAIDMHASGEFSVSGGWRTPQMVFLHKYLGGS